MDSFYIITNILKDKDYAVTEKICNYIMQKGKKWTLAKKDEEGHILPGTVPSDAECGLVLGGDGTLIRAIRDLDGVVGLNSFTPFVHAMKAKQTVEQLAKHADHMINIIGINLGTLGYLAEVELKDYQYAIDRLCGEEHAAIELRMMLEGVAGDEKKDLAVNDIVLTREGNIRIVQFNVYVNGTLLNTYLADGVIISTPTGSTGYNLSAGGPVVEPTASIIVITPICSHALNTSSVVLSAEDVIEVEVCPGRYGRQEEVALCYDGAVQRKMVSGDRVCIRRAEETAKLIKLSKESFMKTMREKMKGN